MKTILQVIVGSVAYGLDNDQSDTDYATVFVMPTDSLLSLQAMPGTEQPRDQSGEGQDSGQWEVKKFMQMALSGNPTVNEVLWVPETRVVDQNHWGTALRFHRRKFLSRRVIGAYSGYAKQQAARLERRYIESGIMNYQMSKHLSHMCRLMIAGTHVVRTGEIMVEVPPIYRKSLLEVKRGLRSRDSAMRWFNDLERDFEDAVKDCSLPEKPDVETLNALLLEIRHAY